MRINAKYAPLWTEKYRYAIVSGGRGSAKSFSVQTFLRDLTYEAGHKIAITRYTMVSAEKSVIPEFTSKLELDKSPYSHDDMAADFELVGRTIKNKRSQSEAFFTGLKTSSGTQTASLKSLEGLTTWSMEEAEELVDDGTDTKSNTFDSLDNSIRKKGIDLRTILTWNPSTEDSFIFQKFFQQRKIPINFNGLVDDTLYIYTTYEDNIENLHPSFMKKAQELKRMNPDRYDHIYMGIPVKDKTAALWKKTTMIAPYRVTELPDLKRVIVAVDPSVTSTGTQDECGIVVIGEDFKQNYYLMEDRSDILSPKEWGDLAAGLYIEHDACMVVAEVNQGGDLVELNIQNSNYGRGVPVEKVRATKGKILRAEPIAMLYEQGRVHHCGQFKELEYEMCNYTGDAGEKSPNRLDALVWGLFYLMTEEEEQVRIRRL